MKNLTNEQLIALTENAIKEIEKRVFERDLYSVAIRPSYMSGYLSWSSSTAGCNFVPFYSD